MKFDWKSKLAPAEKNIGTVIGEGISIENAIIKGSGILRVDGRLSGKIDFDGHIILGSTGYMEGEIHADSALFAGNCQGDIYIKEILHLVPNSYVSGRVETRKFIVDEDAAFSGTSVMKRDGSGSIHESDQEEDSASDEDTISVIRL